MKAALVTLTALGLTACALTPDAGFNAALNCVAYGWNGGDAKAAADCFTEDAIYQDMMSGTVTFGRAALFDFFGGAEGRPEKMTMIWRDRSYDAASSIGFAEFSFHYGSWGHGAARIKITNGKISHWREFWLESESDWDDLPAIKEVADQ